MEAETIDRSRILSMRITRREQSRVINYDFRRPDKFSKEQIRTLEIIHKSFVHLCEQGLSLEMGRPVKMEISGIDQLAFGEFTDSLPGACAMGLLKFHPLKGPMMIEMDPSLATAMVDRLYGGEGAPADGESSALQKSVWEHLLKLMAGWLGESWKNVLPLEAEWKSLETDPRFAKIVPPNELVINVSLKASLARSSGFINICLPFLTLEPILGKLSAQFWYSSVRRKGSGPANRMIRGLLETTAEVAYPAEELTLKEIGELKGGSLIKLKDFEDNPALLRMGGEEVLKLKRRREKRLFLDPLNETGMDNLIGQDLSREEGERGAAELDRLNRTIDHFRNEVTEKISRLEEQQDSCEDRMMLSGDKRDISLVSSDPFGFITAKDIPTLHLTLAAEHPQITAFVLSRLNGVDSASLLSLFDGERQADFIRRICRIEPPRPEMIRLVSENLEKLFLGRDESLSPDPQGVARAAEILNNSSRAVEKLVVESLELSDADLAEEIKKRMFVFEDIVLLDGTTMRTLYERAERKDLLLAMKAVAEQEVLDHIYGQLSEKEKSALSEELNSLGRVRITDVDRAQQKIVELIKFMEEKGEVIIARTDELMPE